MSNKTNKTITGFSKDIEAKLDQLMGIEVIAVPSEKVFNIAPTELSITEQLSLRNKYENLSYVYLKGYTESKGKEYSTHHLITRNALRLLGISDEGNTSKVAELIYESSGPDKNLGKMKLIMEGHFYGKIGDSFFGNYISKYFNKLQLKLMGLIDNIEENAKTNFIEYCSRIDNTPDSIKSRGWAIHYLQDITAPHHAGNYPAYFTSKRKDEKFDTHFEFEKFANELFMKNEHRFDKPSIKAYKIIKGLQFDLTTDSGRGQYIDWIFAKSIQNVDNRIRNRDKRAWEAVIDSAMPIAIASSMCFIDFNRIQAGV